MNKLKIINGVLWAFVVTPIWYFLLYRILTAVNATELMWFLYWIYLPAGLVIQFILKITESEK